MDAKGEPRGDAIEHAFRGVPIEAESKRVTYVPVTLCPDLLQTNGPQISRIDTDKGGVESVFIRGVRGQTLLLGCGCAALGRFLLEVNLYA
jgi:hypothetical protein